MERERDRVGEGDRDRETEREMKERDAREMRTKLHLRTHFWSNNILLETTTFEDFCFQEGSIDQDAGCKFANFWDI